MGQTAGPGSTAPLKVQGKAQYAAEFPAAGLRYGSVVNSTIASGRMRNIHSVPRRNCRLALF